MRVLVLDTYYSSFIDSCYARNPQLADRPYREQWRALMDECFGTADFYSDNLSRLGHEATEIVTNCEELQRRWASENKVRLDGQWKVVRRRGLIPWPRRTEAPDWFRTVLLAQIRSYAPDVLYIQEMNTISPLFLKEVRPHVKLIVGQIAYPIVAGSDFRDYDLILSSFPHYVERFRLEGLQSEYLKLSFEPKVLERLKNETNYDAVFVGSFSVEHSERIEFLEKVAALQPLEVWAHGIECLSPESSLRQRYHGKCWALDMYRVLHNSRIALNFHINTAGPYANNMRLFEATGVGTMLLTDAKSNLATMFKPGKEVVTYRSPEECAELIGYYLSHPAEREEIARAGQERTLREHTYQQRMQELADILQSYLKAAGRGRRRAGV